MNKTISRIIVITTLISLTSCEGIVGSDGNVYDSITKEPIENVKVVLYLNNKEHDTSYSDSNGFFIGSEFVGCVPHCPSAKIELTKEHYKPLIVDFDEYWKENRPDNVLGDNLKFYLERFK